MTTVTDTAPVPEAVPALWPDAAADDVAISVVGLSHWFTTEDSTLEVLRDINLDIQKGQFVSLVGKSGCGKSTLLNIFAGLLTPSSGRLYIADQERREYDLPKRSYITQDTRLLPWRTALANVALPLELHGVPKKERLARARDLLGLVGLSDAGDQRPDQLSGGMRQRVAIAQSLVYDPSVLLMDEPFGALDVWTRESLHDVLFDVYTEIGTTVVLVTHDVNEAVSLSDRIIALAPRPGRILADYTISGDHRPRRGDVIHEPVYAELTHDIRADLGHAG